MRVDCRTENTAIAGLQRFFRPKAVAMIFQAIRAFYPESLQQTR